MSAMTTVGVDALSAREFEVLEAVGEHLTNAEIGQRLHISVRTVESHVSSLLRKSGAADRRELAAWNAEVASRAVATASEISGVPATWTSFIGRTVELAQLSDELATSRLVTLVGPGGMGKTRLVIEAVRQVETDFPAGGAFVDLVPVSAEFVVHAVAAALGVVERAPR